ncbi:cell wall-binding repeat-containing protein [Microbacterium hominis]|uniref:Cell wall-binding repeat-containing protein n=1 Tax=Microbacterium hominis TaxID=162426 RepID=A0A7D4PXA3_9MICO|nr:cell wall-binding repeat-containing protein [Microbacterium hominis]QKJ20854.1 cell wall-binding repeat-containing protein [Microbacterium hominis]
MPRALLRSVAAMVGVIPLVLGLAAPAHAEEATGIVRGVLLDELGGLLVREESNVRISLFADDELTTPAVVFDIASGANGQFAIPDVPAGRYAVKFEPLSSWIVGEWWGDTRRAAERAFITLEDGGVVDLEARLSSTVALSGIVTGRQTDYVVGGTNITVRASTGDAELDSWIRFPTTSLRLSERYVLRVPAGTYTVTATDSTGAHATKTVAGVVVASDTTQDIALTAARASISGTWAIRTASGIVPWGSGHIDVYKWSTTQARWLRIDWPAGGTSRSSYLIDGLGAGRYKLAFFNDGVTTFWGGGDLQSAPEIVLGKNETRSGVDIVVDDSASVSGVVKGKTATGSTIALSGAEVKVWRVASSGALTPVDASFDSLPTGGDGAFRAALAPGTYVFKVWIPGSPEFGASYLGGARLLEDATRVTVGLGQDRVLADVLLPRSSFQSKRVAGIDRFATAVAASKRVVPTGQRAPVVYLTNAFDFPDALAAAPAAIRSGGVILPVAKTSVPQVVLEELRRLQPRRVVLVGGTGVVGSAVSTAVKKVIPADARVSRLGGASRYETADAIVRDAFGAGGSRYAIVATGATYPDALAAGPAAGHLDAPVLLVDGARGLTAATTATIGALGITDVYIAGGRGAVSPTLESGLKALLGTSRVKRLSGSDRYFTAIAVNDAIFADVDDAFLASGAGFADALAGAPLAGRYDAPLYLSSPTCINAWTLQSIRERQAARVTLLGGEGVLSKGVAAFRTCSS